MLNGVTHLMLMKIDVMNEFETIKYCEEYIIDGERTMELPFDMEQTMEPVYSSCKGWQQNIEGIERYEDLPENMRQYISKLEEKTGLPIVLVSTSPNRKDTIIRTEI